MAGLAPTSFSYMLTARRRAQCIDMHTYTMRRGLLACPTSGYQGLIGRVEPSSKLAGWSVGQT